MSQYNPEQYAQTLVQAISPLLPPDARPRVIRDTNEKGAPVLELVVPNPTEPRHAVSLTVSIFRGAVDRCALRFGQVEVSAALDAEDAIPAIREILAGRIVAVARYKTRDAYDGRRMASYGFIQNLYQLPDDEDALAALREKLARPATAWDKLMGKLTGVFEVYTWDTSEAVERA